MNAPMTPERLAEIRDRRAKAAEGPWWWRNSAIGDAPILFGKGHRVVVTFARMGMHSAQPVFRDRQDSRLLENAGKENLNSFPDAVFIAHAPQDIDDLLAQVDWLAGLLGSHADGHRCSCTMLRGQTLHEPAEWEQDPWCLTHPDMDAITAEVDRLRAQVAAVKACLPRWESEVDEQTRVKEFGIAEGLRVALQDVRQAFGAGDGYCICDSISRPERDCGVAEHRRAALASGDGVQP